MNETAPDATNIFAPIWRRKWLILAVALLVGVASYFYFKRQRPTFQNQTQVFLGASAEEQTLAGHTNRTKNSALSGQATIVTAIVVEEVRQKLRREHRAGVIKKAKIHAKIPEKTELLQITAEAHSPRGTALLANLVAQTYIKRQETKRTRAIRREIAISRTQLARIEAASAAREAASRAASKSKNGAASTRGSSASSVIQATNLSTKIDELETSLGQATAVQLRPAKPANAVLQSPKPRKDAIFGFVIAFVLACVAAVVAARLDRRVRSLEAMESAYGLPLLTVLPKVGKPIVREAGSARPSVRLLEPLRRLDTELMTAESVDAAGLAQRRRVLLVVSADPGDGKSTLVAGLALAQREAGKQVVVLEANFRRPVLARTLGLEPTSMLPEVLTGRVELEDAMQRVPPLYAAQARAGGDGPGAVATATQAGVGSLFVLTADRSVANPPALLSQPVTAEVVTSLASRFDYVLIDAPSPFEFTDAVPLFGMVDGIIVVCRAGHTREASALRLRQMLAGHEHARPFGVVGNFVSSADMRRHGFAGGSGWLGGGRTGP
jgi:Mrp family chromosome partitioning ATPase/capsular polysaccharide biosynthesis protein